MKDDPLKKTIEEIHKKFGKESLIQMDQDPEPIEVIPSGSILLDRAMGVGGYPKGRIIEIYGAESGGKTTLALHAIAEAQKMGEKVAFIDAEYALDLKYAQNIGVNTNDLLMSQPNSGEEALEITDSLIRSNEIGIIIIDSVAALTPRAEVEGDMGQSHMGLQARLMSQALRKLSSVVSKTDCVLIFINQIRHKIGIIFGSPETTTGGNALKFYASIRLDIRRKKKIMGYNNEVIGNDVLIKVVKNKVAPPFKEAETTIMFGKGIGVEDEIITLCVEQNIIEKAGSWYKYKEDNIQGNENMRQFVKENWDELHNQLTL